MRVRAVICDFGGVLTSPLIDSIRAWTEHMGLTVEGVGQAMASVGDRIGEHPLFRLEKGELTEAEFTRLLETELGMSFDGYPDRYLDHLEPNPPMIDYVAKLRDRGLRTALLTNNVREWEPIWRSMLPVDDLFEVVVDSAFVGMRKPDPAIYELTLERLDGELKAEECVFVDDTEPNCVAARDLGMHAVLFHHADQAIADVERILSENENETRSEGV